MELNFLLEIQELWSQHRVVEDISTSLWRGKHHCSFDSSVPCGQLEAAEFLFQKSSLGNGFKMQLECAFVALPCV